MSEEGQAQDVEIGDVWHFTVKKPLASGKIDIVASADSYVDDAQPTTNYGNASSLKIRVPSADDTKGNTQYGYAKFDVVKPVEFAEAEIAQAKLYLYRNSQNSSTTDVDVYATNNATWNEQALTWDDNPLVGGNPLDPAGHGVTSSILVLANGAISM